MPPIVIVAPEDSYRTAAFLRAAATLRAEVVVAGTVEHPLAATNPDLRHLAVDLSDPADAADRIAAAVPDAIAVLGIDDAGVLAANAAAKNLQLRHNPPAAVAATRNKVLMRTVLADSDIDQPAFAVAGPGRVATLAAEIGFPTVIKPAELSAGRGVIRADNKAEAAAAEARIRRILVEDCGDDSQDLLVERFVAGAELAIEGLLGPNGLDVLAVIDKPEPSAGPHFAETFLITPSRLPAPVQAAAGRLVAQACDALGLATGPIHAEARLGAAGEPILLELAARSIGGLCSRALTFGMLGESLEVLILRAALDWEQTTSDPQRPATGVLMLPIPSSGVFLEVEGVDRAQQVPGVDDLQITVSPGSEVQALPEGSRYLGFVFASDETPEAVERSLRQAAAELTVVIDGEAVDPLIGQPWARD